MFIGSAAIFGSLERRFAAAHLQLTLTKERQEGGKLTGNPDKDALGDGRRDAVGLESKGTTVRRCLQSGVDQRLGVKTLDGTAGREDWRSRG